MEQKYWRSLEEYTNSEVVNPGLPAKKEDESIFSLLENEMEMRASRRDFLKLFGFSVTAAALAASCERPVQKAIPYLIKPEEITPGKASHYASSFFDGEEYCSILIKVRDGRPIKIEGNELSSVSGGGTSARVQASVLDLYDSARPQFPRKKGDRIEWEQADREITSALKKIDRSGKSIVILSSTLISPATQHVIKAFRNAYPSTRWISYDAVSSSAILQANEINFGKPFLPDYRFGEADLIVAFNADFLGTWISPVEYTRSYMEKRRLHNGQSGMSHHVQFETHYTITGSKADKRFPIKPSEEKHILASLYTCLLEKSGGQKLTVPTQPVDVIPLAEDILHNKNRTLVVSGSNDTDCQLLVNAINHIAGSYGNTISLTSESMLRQGLDKEVSALIDDMNKGNVGAMLLLGANPAYNFPGKEFTQGLEKVQLTVSLNDKDDESSNALQYFCPDSHYLESWNDAHPSTGYYSLQQPVIHPMFDTRQAQESLLRWTGNSQSYYDYLRDFWKKEIFPLSDKLVAEEEFWNKSLRDGIFEPGNHDLPKKFIAADLRKIVEGIQPATGSIECYLYESVALGSGKHSNNPWLAEMPDPMTKVSWDHFVAVSPLYAQEKGWMNGSVVKINDTIELPVLIQPGHAYGAVSIALGYGHTLGGKVATGLGANAYPLLQRVNGNRIPFAPIETITATGKTKPLALVQMHDSMEGRPIVRESDLSEYLKNPSAGNEMHAEFEKKHVSLYKDTHFDGFHWGLMVDLNACTSCGACIIACQAENNIPVIGREQVMRHRIMHWIRIDRYYNGSPENPKTVHQPVMCQHCDQAPCENVCPVSATNHSNEGLNQIAYNRCIGTKYCINNCPYKVRRFNWFQFAENAKFDYNMNSDLGRMVLNPDVTVRERGVVEKCSFCVQRIQEKKLEAKLGNRSLRDGELKTACVQACPAKALVFGNMNDPESQVSKMMKDPRNYHLLEELHTLPSVGYLTLVRNKKEENV
jgi:Fe-S-cluster-containing dehydrogenase component/anaerobic selenocysteine-containing dehydrogenase